MKSGRLWLVILAACFCAAIIALYHFKNGDGASLSDQMQASEQRDLAKIEQPASHPTAKNLSQSAGPSPTTYDQQFPLHMAASENDTQTLSALLTQGADVNARDKEQRTPLHMASQALVHGQEAIKILIEHHADVNGRDSDDRTPLMYALGQFRDDENALPVATLLVENGADVNACDLYDNCPLETAYRNQLLDVVLLLIRKNANLNGKAPGHDTILHMVAAQTPDQFVGQFNEGISGEALGRGNTWPPELKNQIAFAAFLIEKGADVNAVEEISKTTPVTVAAREKNYPLAEFFLSKGAILDTGTNAAFAGKGLRNPIDTAIEDGDLDRVKFLMDHGVKLSAAPNSFMPSIILAIHKRNQSITEFLIHHGANVNESTSAAYISQSPLTLAVEIKDVDAVSLLLANGADPNAKDSDGRTALQYAAMDPAPSQTIIDMLKQYGTK